MSRMTRLIYMNHPKQCEGRTIALAEIKTVVVQYLSTLDISVDAAGAQKAGCVKLPLLLDSTLR